MLLQRAITNFNARESCPSVEYFQTFVVRIQIICKNVKAQ